MESIIVFIIILAISIIIFYLNSNKGSKLPSDKRDQKSPYNMLTLIIALVITAIIVSIIVDAIRIHYSSRVWILLICYALTAFIIVRFWLSKSKISSVGQTFQSSIKESTAFQNEESLKHEDNSAYANTQNSNSLKRGKLFDEQYTQAKDSQTFSKYSDQEPKFIPKKFRTGLIGYARNMEKRQVRGVQNTEEEYLAFRLEILDSVGNIIQILPVELRAKEVTGRIMEGDKIIVVGKTNKNGILIPNSVLNLKTNEIIGSKSVTFFGTTMGCMMSLLFAASFLGIAVGLFMAIGSFAERESGSGIFAIGLLVLIGSIIGMILSIYTMNKKKLY